MLKIELGQKKVLQITFILIKVRSADTDFQFILIFITQSPGVLGSSPQSCSLALFSKNPEVCVE